MRAEIDRGISKDHFYVGMELIKRAVVEIWIGKYADTNFGGGKP